MGSQDRGDEPVVSREQDPQVIGSWGCIIKQASGG